MSTNEKEGISPLKFDSGNKLVEINIKKKLPEINRSGFIESKRAGDTGVGYTLEEELGIAENNKRTQDLIYQGKKVELKAQRSSTTSPVTLFSQKPRKPNLTSKKMLAKYGYTDKKGRLALYVTLKVSEPNPQGLMLRVDEEKDKLYVSHSKDGDLWFWNTNNLKLKVERLLFVVADSKKIDGKEYFHYVEAYFLIGFNKNRFLQLIEQGKIVVDMRMYLKKSGAVRDHGIAFRGKFKDFKVCYDTQESLIGSRLFTSSIRTVLSLAKCDKEKIVFLVRGLGNRILQKARSMFDPIKESVLDEWISYNLFVITFIQFLERF